MTKKQFIESEAYNATIDHIAIILEHHNGYDKSNCKQLARECEGDEIFELILKTNKKFITKAYNIGAEGKRKNNKKRPVKLSYCPVCVNDLEGPHKVWCNWKG